MASRSWRCFNEPDERGLAAEHNPVLIHGSPEIIPHAIDVEEHFVQMPLVAAPETPFPQTSGIIVAELVAPAPDRFVADQYAARGHRLFHIPKTDRKPVVTKQRRR